MPKDIWKYEIGDCGIELEFMKVYREGAQFINSVRNKLPGYKIVHDASSETPSLNFGGIPATVLTEQDRDFLNRIGFGNTIIIGGEITSPILRDAEWKDNIYKLCEILHKFGESENTIRDSLHIHLNVGDSVPLTVLKRLLKLSASYEAIFYRLGGMGRVNRGQENQYTYQRPYLGHGPIVVEHRGRYYPILDYKDLMNANSKLEFFQRYGSADRYGADNTRYVTMRYMGVNFYPILTQGSIEFRHANKTISPEWMLAWANFCKSILVKSFYFSPTPDEEIMRPLYKNEVIEDNDFIEVLENLPLDNETKEILLQIWILSPTPTFDNIYRTSHLNNPTFFTEDYKTKVIPVDADVKRAIFVDVHQLGVPARQQRIVPNIEERINPGNPDVKRVFQEKYNRHNEIDVSKLSYYSTLWIYDKVDDGEDIGFGMSLFPDKSIRVIIHIFVDDWWRDFDLENFNIYKVSEEVKDAYNHGVLKEYLDETGYSLEENRDDDEDNEREV